MIWKEGRRHQGNVLVLIQENDRKINRRPCTQTERMERNKSCYSCWASREKHGQKTLSLSEGAGAPCLYEYSDGFNKSVRRCLFCFSLCIVSSLSFLGFTRSSLCGSHHCYVLCLYDSVFLPGYAMKRNDQWVIRHQFENRLNCIALYSAIPFAECYPHAPEYHFPHDWNWMPDIKM